jgi:hypothetical protein
MFSSLISSNSGNRSTVSLLAMKKPLHKKIRLNFLAVLSKAVNRKP